MKSLLERHIEASRSEVARQAILNFIAGLTTAGEVPPPGTAPGIGPHITCDPLHPRITIAAALSLLDC